MAENVEPLNRFNDLGMSRMQFFRCQSRNCGISKLSEGWVYEQRRVGETLGRLTASNSNQHDRQTKWFTIAAHPQCFSGAGINQPSN